MRVGQTCDGQQNDDHLSPQVIFNKLMQRNFTSLRNIVIFLRTKFYVHINNETCGAGLSF